jgi:anti-sigma regulatory factor (Ser/Thr protein kinase)
MATAAYGVFDPEAGVLKLASAGHPPPIVATGHSSRALDIAPAPPLGAFPYGSYTDMDVQLASGETIVLYTDGLVERPSVSVSDGIERLAEIVATADSVEDTCVLAVDRLVPPAGPRDDVAIIALRNTPLPAELDLRLPADPGVLSGMRHALRRWLGAQGATRADLAEITMAVSEACANAVEHAYSPGPNDFHLAASRGDGVVTLTVSDTGRWRAPRGHDRGRGLSIIRAAMDEVDIERTTTGTTITMRRRLGSG